MRLIVPMYHRASAGRYGNAPEVLDAHFAHIARSFHGVMPGESLHPERVNVCLTFDDGTRDFRDVVYPLLRKHRLRAVLAVPLGFLQDGPRNAQAYCSWADLEEMIGEGVVSVAAHGFTHRRLDIGTADLHAEIAVPQTVLAARLGCAVESFVLPYGRFSDDVLAEARRHYRYIFRIGGADNTGWDGPLIYRVDADAMIAPDALFARGNLLSYRLRRRWNLARRR